MNDAYQYLDAAALTQLREIQRHNLNHLLTQAKNHGSINVPLHIQNQIDDILADIAELNGVLESHAVAGSDPPPGTPPQAVIQHYHAPVTQHNQSISASGGSTISGATQSQTGGAGGDQSISAENQSNIRDVEQRIDGQRAEKK